MEETALPTAQHQNYFCPTKNSIKNVEQSQSKLFPLNKDDKFNRFSISGSQGSLPKAEGEDVNGGLESAGSQVARAGR